VDNIRLMTTDVPASIPTMSQWGLMALSSILAIATVLFGVRRNWN
jgi:hypothetical protein